MSLLVLQRKQSSLEWLFALQHDGCSMASSLIRNLEKLLDGPRDNALLRFSLGNEHLKAGEPELALLHLRKAVEKAPLYSAAWKLLGRALTDNNQLEEALRAYTRGIAVAESKGDKQAAKEMSVFARRIERERGV